jgi:hypothetical protein
MFTAEIIQSRLRQAPFLPLRIIISSGQTFDVYHPDLVLIGQRDMIIGMASKRNPAVYERVTRVPLMHITALEDLPTPSATHN